MKTIGATMQTALEASHVEFIAFIELDFVSGVERYTTCGFDLSWGGHAWKGLGGLVTISEIRESSALEAVGVKLELSGVPTAAISLALNEKPQGRSAKIWFAVFDSDSGALVDDPMAEYAGRMDVLSLTRGAQSCTIALNVESRLADFARPSNGRFTDADQQRRHAGDLFFSFVAQFSERELVFFSKEQQYI